MMTGIPIESSSGDNWFFLSCRSDPFFHLHSLFYFPLFMSVSDILRRKTPGFLPQSISYQIKETTDFTVYLRNSTNPIVSLTLRQAIRFFVFYRRPATLQAFAGDLPIPATRYYYNRKPFYLSTTPPANSCCHHVLRHFRFQKCLPVNRNMSIQNVYVLQKTSYLRAVAAVSSLYQRKSRNAARSTTTTLAPAGVEYV